MYNSKLHPTQPNSTHSCSIRLSPTSTPTPSFAFLLHMHNDLHTSIFQKLCGTNANIFEICRAGSDDVDYAENALFLGSM